MVSIDGASQEIYSIYRVNGNFDTVINNIKKINEYKKKYNNDFPLLKWQYILFEHNEHEVIKAKLLAKELNMQIIFKPTWDQGYVPKNPEMLLKETELKWLTREDTINNDKNFRLPVCQSLWLDPQINYDGYLLGCPCNVQGFGINVFNIGLKKAINSKSFKIAKLLLQGKISVDEIDPKIKENIPCVNCDTYFQKVKTNTYLNYNTKKKAFI